MSTLRTYITNAIPYVNGDPHIGHALEFVEADVLARHRRLRGESVRYLSGTDDNALKNVQAAEAAGRPVVEFVAERAEQFERLRDPLQLSHDDFIRTSSDPRHRPGVERLWRACHASGDLYEREYEGLYCTGCEAFVTEDELVDGRCPEHREPPERVRERNWFFRLSRYRDALLDVLDSGRLRVEPESRRNEVLALVRSGLDDFSVSRPRERAHGWGIPVPDDPSQVIYVWFDALGNYVTALDYASGGNGYRDWWETSDERLHVIGKGIVRFHAIYWPAILISAGQPLPTTIFVHDYLTAHGEKLSKSLGNSPDLEALIDRYGVDALRWWLVRGVPREGDADFREELIADRANELADDLGNLVNRTVSLVNRFRPDGVGSSEETELLPALDGLGEAIDGALERFDFRAAADALWQVVSDANRLVARSKPWELAKREESAAELDAVLSALVTACRRVAVELRPFLPDASERIDRVLDTGDPALGRTLFPKLVQSR